MKIYTKLNVLNDYIQANGPVMANQVSDNSESYKQENSILNPSTIQNEHALIQVFKDESSENVLNFISEYLSINNQKTILFTTKQQYLTSDLDFNNIRSIVNLQEVNKHQQINNFFRSINTLLPDAGLYIGCVEPYHIRKRKMEKRYGRLTTKILWSFDFVFNRVMPRISLTKGLHYFITHNRYRVLSLSETLGRLVYCGFEIIEYREIDNKVYFVSLKTGEPKISDTVSKGPFFKMKRIGKNGKLIGVYKLRTMHPYSEYLHKYVIQSNGYNEYGKVKDDFRVTVWSKTIRKLYLDEIPQLINVIKGDMNLVGVRPLSQVSYNLLPDDLKQERIKYKPGCIPPYIALGTKGLEGVLEAERIYLLDMKNAPLKTNVKYFFMAMFNLLTFRVSSN